MDEFFESELRKHYRLELGDSSQWNDLYEVEVEQMEMGSVLEHTKKQVPGYKVYVQNCPCSSCCKDAFPREFTLGWKMFEVRKEGLDSMMLCYDCGGHFNNRCVYERETDYINLEKALDPNSVCNLENLQMIREHTPALVEIPL